MVMEVKYRIQNIFENVVGWGVNFYVKWVEDLPTFFGACRDVRKARKEVKEQRKTMTLRLDYPWQKHIPACFAEVVWMPVFTSKCKCGKNCKCQRSACSQFRDRGAYEACCEELRKRKADRRYWLGEFFGFSR